MLLYESKQLRLDATADDMEGKVLAEYGKIVGSVRLIGAENLLALEEADEIAGLGTSVALLEREVSRTSAPGDVLSDLAAWRVLLGSAPCVSCSGTYHFQGPLLRPRVNSTQLQVTKFQNGPGTERRWKAQV